MTTDTFEPTEIKSTARWTVAGAIAAVVAVLITLSAFNTVADATMGNYHPASELLLSRVGVGGGVLMWIGSVVCTLNGMKHAPTWRVLFSALVFTGLLLAAPCILFVFAMAVTM